jgi:hypothetical protein
VIELDLDLPFTAARARKCGFRRIRQIRPDMRPGVGQACRADERGRWNFDDTVLRAGMLGLMIGTARMMLDIFHFLRVPRLVWRMKRI